MVLTVCIAILVIGSFFTYGTMVNKDTSMREDLLANTKVAATAVNISDIKALAGSPDDLNNSHYQKLKVLMTAQREAIPSARFVYLMGQYDNGTIFFFIDSEPADSPDNSPPGQIYDVPSVTIDNAFKGIADTGGPLADQWGVWVSGMVPIFDPDTGKVIAVLGMDISANHWGEQTIESGLVPGLTAVLITTLVVIFFTLQIRRKEENRKLSEAAEALRESSEKYRTLIENSQDAVFIIQDGKLAFISPSIERIIGFNPENMLDRPFMDFIAPEDRTRVGEMARALIDRKGGAGLERVRLLRHDGPKEALADLSISIIDYHGRWASMGTLHDQTAQETAEIALIEANRKLQLMTGITRHDILNQLMVLRGNLELAKNAKNPASAHSLEARAMEAATNIENMIAFTKDYQDIGMNAPSWQYLPSLVSKASEGMSKSGLDLQEQMPNMEILTDPLIVKVFHNLIDNALRHGKRATRMEFSARVEDGSLLIVVQDDGIGIDAKDKRRIFERGFGKHTGMGLFFSREVLSITGITIDEMGEPGHGASFVLRVPAGKWRSASSPDMSMEHP
jgi:PAS domain S-box-containing protein